MVKIKTNRVYVDTVMFIYYLEGNSRGFSKVEKFFRKIERDGTKIVVSSLVLTELFVAPYKQRANEVVNQWLLFFRDSQQVEVVDLTPQIALDAAFLRAKYGFKAPDAIHLATAMNARVDCFVSNDRGLGKIEEVRVVFPLK